LLGSDEYGLFGDSAEKRRNGQQSEGLFRDYEELQDESLLVYNYTKPSLTKRKKDELMFRPAHHYFNLYICLLLLNAASFQPSIHPSFLPCFIQWQGQIIHKLKPWSPPRPIILITRKL